MSDLIFVDTTVLVYALDSAAGTRHSAARRWTTALWQSRRGRLRVQVLQELYITLTRKLKPWTAATRCAGRGAGISAVDAHRDHAVDSGAGVACRVALPGRLISDAHFSAYFAAIFVTILISILYW